MQKKFCALVMLSFLCWLPNQILAEKQVSQEFQVGQSSQENTIYFPQENGEAILLVDGKFYYSKTPNTVNTWELINISFSPTNPLTFEPLFSKVVSYKGYNYVSSSYTIKENHTNKGEIRNTEIWRLKKSNPKKLEKVAELKNTGFLAFINVFNNKLLITGSNGKSWLSTNGISYTEKNITGLPKNLEITSAVVINNDDNKSQFFVSGLAQKNLVYYSNNLSRWHKNNAKFPKKEKNIRQLVEFNNALYTVSEINDNNCQVLKLVDKKWQLVYSLNAETAFLQSTDNNLYLSDYFTEKDKIKIIQTADGKNFTQIYSSAVNDNFFPFFIAVDDELFARLELNKFTLSMYRVK